MFNWKHIVLGSLVPLGTAFCVPAAAEDIDLFVGVGGAGTAKSDILFVFDTGANFSNSSNEGCFINSTTGQARTTSATGFTATLLTGSAAGVQQCAMYSVLGSLTADQIANLRVGVVGFNAGGGGLKSYDPLTGTMSSSCPSNGNGGCVLVPLTDLSNATSRRNLLSWVENLRTSGNSDYNIKGSNSGYTGAAMQETWAYLAGKQGISTRNYENSHLSESSCKPKSYVIYLANALNNAGTPKDQNSSPELTLKGTAAVADQRANPAALASDYATVRGDISTRCGNYTFDSAANSVSNGIYSAHWASYLRRLGVTSYGVGVIAPGSCKPDYPAQLSLLASKGGGKYFDAINFEELRVSLETILDEITAVNGVFASASLPVSVNTQGTYLNQVFVGMFRPDPNTLPRWSGNLKQYKFKAIQTDGSYDLKLVGADDVSAINANTGFITQCARSFWGPSSAPDVDYWSDVAGAGLGTCTSRDPTGLSDFPDGDVVEKGGAGYRLRVAKLPADRNIKTCTGDCASLTNFSSTTALLNWVRGEDGLDEKRNNNLTEMRPSVHGDVVHSRPVAVDYGGTTGVVVYYGSNDGMLRAINGNQTGTAAGDELWAFVAPEHSSRFARIYANDVAIDFPSLNNPATQKPYFFDGPVTAHKEGNTVWIFATQRRGGRMVYAFNVSTPASPSIKWRAGCTGSTDDSCTSANFTGIGQTWSSPRVIRTQAVGSSTPLLIFGGGYDTCDDTDNGTTNNSCTAPKGNQVYVLNADTGALVKKFDTLRSVVGDVTVVRNASGLAEYGYAADMGGNVYRIKLTGASTSDWDITRIAALGRDTVPASSTDGASARKFMYGPEIVVVPTRGFNAVLLGSGDREHPLLANSATAAVQNYFYMLMDKPTVASWLTDESTACGGTGVLCHASLLNIVATSTATVAANLDGKKGWRMQLRAQEQVVTSAVALFGEVTFSTHQPVASSTTNTTSCTNSLGTARVYNVSYLNAAPPLGGEDRGKTISGGGLPPSPVAGLVTVDKPGGGQMTVPFIIGATPDSPLEVKLKDKSSTASGNKERIYWFIQK
jgi:type IV pilus assembly protein PilY1